MHAITYQIASGPPAGRKVKTVQTSGDGEKRPWLTVVDVAVVALMLVWALLPAGWSP